MKKNKNENVNASESKENTVRKNIPSENDEQDILFKKVLYGYNPEEVEAFIKELNERYEASLRLNEAKLSSIKEELVLSNRERDCYIEKCREYKNLAETVSVPREDKSAEYEAEILLLKERIAALENENESLKSMAENSSAADVYAEKITLLENINSELEENLSDLREENSGLRNQLGKFEDLSEEYKAVFMQYEESKSLVKKYENEIKDKDEIISECNEKISSLNIIKEDSEKKISELEIQNGILTRRASENEEEISALKESNKTLAVENAEKINALENEHAKSRLAVQKELKLYGYYVDRAELTLAELTKQMEQIRQTIADSEI